MKILFACSEYYPLMRTNDVADFSAGLTAAIGHFSHDIRIIMPAYPEAVNAALPLKTVANLEINGCKETIRLLEGQIKGCDFPVYLVEATAMFSRHGHPYKDAHGNNRIDNLIRFTLFNQIITLVALNHASISWRPDIVHCNDWQTGLVPALLAQDWNRPATVFSCHQISEDGDFPLSMLEDIKIPHSIKQSEHNKVNQQFSLLQTGITYSDLTLAGNQLFTERLSAQPMDPAIRNRFLQLHSRLKGIDSGVDYSRWNPINDSMITQAYDASTCELKKNNKRSLQPSLSLKEESNVLLLCIFSDLGDYNGDDDNNQENNPLLPDVSIFETILKRHNIQLCICPNINHTNPCSEQLARNFPGQVSIIEQPDETQLHQLIAASDAALFPNENDLTKIMPDVCLHYGTIPIIASTMGYQQHIVDATSDHLLKETANAFLYNRYEFNDLEPIINKMILYYYRPGPWWKKLATHSMIKHYSWVEIAQKFIDSYQYAIDNPASNPDKDENKTVD